MTVILNCASREAALKSLSECFQCQPSELKRVLILLDLDVIYEQQPRVLIPCEQYLYNFVIEHLGEHLPLTQVMWFHGTRTAPNNDFAAGIGFVE